MTALNEIRINNIRKFGEEIIIPIEKGATIFLAPNGTGKTSLFEAIEFGLTGAVQRLGTDSLDNLIRDQYSDACVSLKFENGITGNASLKKGGQPKLTGNINDIFGTIKPENIPFLLRITHLLDQQSSKWFVQSDSNLAGSLLQNLSIARDASKANEVMLSAKKAAGQKRTKIEEERNAAKEELVRWQNLVGKRNIERDSQKSSLKPLQELRDHIKFIAVDYIDEPTEIREDLSEINIAFKQVEQTVSTFFEDKIKQQNEYAHLMNLIKEFDQKKELQKEIESILNSKQLNQKVELDRANTIQDQLLSKLKSVTEIQEELEKNENLKKQKDTLTSSRLELNKNNETVGELQKELNKLGLEARASVARIEEYEKINLEYNNHTEAKNKLESERDRIEILDQLLVKWKRLEQEFLESKSSHLARSNELKVLKSEKNNLKYQNDNNLKRYQELLNKFNGFSQASSAIQDAVGIIALNLSDKEGQCPVCLSNFNPHDLKKRIDEAINMISPELNRSKEEISTAKELIEKINIEIFQIEDKEKSLDKAIEALDEKIAIIDFQIEVDIKPNFEMKDNHADATEYLSRKIKKIKSDTSELEKSFSPTNRLISEEELRALRKNLNEVNLMIIEKRDAKTNFEQKNINLQNLINSIEKFGLDKLEGIENKISIGTKSLNEINSDIVTLRNKKSELDEVILTLRNEIHLKQNENYQILESITELLQRWKAAGFNGEFEQKKLDQHGQKLKELVEKSKDSLNTLNELGIELAGWTAHDTFFRTQNEISTLCGNRTESEFDDYLNEKYVYLSKSLEKVLEKSAMLNSFSVNLSNEIDTVNDQILSINPFWKKLLQRTVVDPRFAQTTLNSYSYYKKPQAEVKVSLHGNEVLASHVASEAQLTDLQLTFLLSMAYKYQWSNWKGLLLDDPTQHHDLVHAAGVFDLLRDYIFDHDFQVLLSTHDPIHAKFFMRKLENDGVPVKLWTLRPTNSGVIALPG